MRVAIDAVGIRGYGGAAVLRELLIWLPVVRPDWTWHLFLLAKPLRDFDLPQVPETMTVEETRMGNNALERLTWVNQKLPAKLGMMENDLLFSFANLTPSSSPIRQVVFCHQRNAFFPDALPPKAILKRLRMHIMQKYILRGARASTAVIVQTDALRGRIIDREPSLEGRIHVVPSGYHTYSDEPNIRTEKRTLIDGTARPRLIYVSHPSEHKNHIALVQAMPKILETIPSAKLLLTLDRQWRSSRRYISFVAAIQKAAEKLGVSEQLVWLGILNPDEVAYALATSDVMVFPSLAESFGLGLAESLASGCPITVADISYAREVCGEAAVYFDPRKPDEIAKSVLSVLQDEHTSERLRALGAKRMERFSYERIAGEMTLVFEKAMASKNNS